MKYRAEIDGLRALAVIPVILFHAGFELLSGGFVGVDVFFVISGYLITTILIEDMENKRFSLVNFYERRAKRILPALFFVFLISSIAYPFALSESALISFYNSGIASSLFISNIFFWKQSGYFENAAELTPFLHTWSLAVEEQYYVFFPVFLILAWRFGKSRVFWMIVVMAAASLLLSEWGWRNQAIANFYLAPTRAWELFAGSIAAFIVQKRGVQKNNALALLGLSAIVFSTFFYDKNTPFPSIYALVPVLGAVLLILYANKETLAAKLLSTKAFVAIGLISYSLYLWHQPLLVFFRINNEPFGDWWIFLAIMMTLLFGFLSHRYIEVPCRYQWKGTKVTFILFASSFIFALVFMIQKNFVPSLLDFEVVNNEKVSQAYLSRVDGSDAAKILNFNQLGKYHRLSVYTYDPNSSCKIILLGDSHSMHLQNGLANVLYNPKECSLVAIQSIGCPPFFGYTYAVYGDSNSAIKVNEVQSDCAEINEFSKLFIHENANDISAVIVSARWNWLVSPVNVMPPVKKRVLIPSNAVEDGFVISEMLSQYNREENFKNALSNSVSFFESLNLPVYYISQPPLQKMDLRNYTTIDKFDEARPESQISVDRNKAAENAFVSILNIKSGMSRYVSLINLFCPIRWVKCKNRVGKNSLYFDEDHLSVFGAEYVTRHINQKIQ